MAHYNVLVLEGGGAKGPYELGVLEVLERLVGKPSKDFIKLVVSTSVGTVIGGILCTGKKPASEWSKMVLDNLPRVFKKRGWFFPLPKYDPKNYVSCYHEYVGTGILMRDLPVWLMCTSVDRCEPRTHFFKSWEEKDGALPVTDVTIRSFSAPYFFGATIDERDKKVWMDGGMGSCNLPLMNAFIEILRQKWLDQGNTCHILAIGSGCPDESTPFDKAKRYGIIEQTIDQFRRYLDVSDGGLAREMSGKEQVTNLQAMLSAIPNLTFQYIDWEGMPKKLDKMDDVKDRYVYYKKGLEDGKKIDPTLFKV